MEWYHLMNNLFRDIYYIACGTLHMGDQPNQNLITFEDDINILL